jgi:hypothetical protein
VESDQEGISADDKEGIGEKKEGASAIAEEAVRRKQVLQPAVHLLQFLQSHGE